MPAAKGSACTLLGPINGDWYIGAIGLANLSLNCVEFPRAGRIEIIDFGMEKNDELDFIRHGGIGDDLKINIDFVAELKLLPNPGIDQGVGVESSIEGNKPDISELDLKVGKIAPMLAELRDQFQAEIGKYARHTLGDSSKCRSIGPQ